MALDAGRGEEGFYFSHVIDPSKGVRDLAEEASGQQEDEAKPCHGQDRKYDGRRGRVAEALGWEWEARGLGGGERVKCGGAMVGEQGQNAFMGG
jgi:hypothetical protein